jgi:ferrochelatase
MEVIYDLDTEARKLCVEMGMNMVRAATAGTHLAFIRMIRELLLERMDSGQSRRFLGGRGLGPDVCLSGCCLPKA